MAICTIETNLPHESIPENFDRKFCDFVAELLDKPLANVILNLKCGQRMFTNQSSDPAILVTVKAIGVFDADRNKSISTPMYRFLRGNLKVDVQRMLVLFDDLPRVDKAKRPIQINL
ncbi:DDT (predicted) [Pycnogonum litorale]